MARSTRTIGWGGPAAVLGILLPLVSQALLPIWDFPATSTSDAALVSWVHAHHDALVASIVLDGVAVTLWAVFGADLAFRLRRLAPDSALPAVLAVGFAGLTTLLLSGFTAFCLLVGQAPAPQVAGFAYDLCFGLLAMSGVPTVASMAAYAVLAARQRVLGRPTVVLAIVAAVAHVLLLPTVFFRHGPFALEGPGITVAPMFLFAWIAWTGVGLLREDLGERVPVSA